jgi:hypothetical protein
MLSRLVDRAARFGRPRSGASGRRPACKSRSPGKFVWYDSLVGPGYDFELVYRYTRHQVARGALSDAEAPGKIYLFKRVSQLGATYQIRLLAYMAWKNGLKLVLRVPKDCALRPSLRALQRKLPALLVVERVEA